MIALKFDGDPVLTSPHGVPVVLDGGSESQMWSVTDEGILVKGENAVRRTRGAPITVGNIRLKHESRIDLCSLFTNLPSRLIAAVAAIESGGNPEAERYEAKIDDYSFGVMQTLTTTAAYVVAHMNERAQLPPCPAPKDWPAWRRYLFDPLRSLKIGSLYLAHQDSISPLTGDPILMYAAYNAGSLHPSTHSPWGLVSYGNAMDHFAQWYGDACEVYAVDSIRL
jgi:hypothetical protein